MERAARLTPSHRRCGRRAYTFRELALWDQAEALRFDAECRVELAAEILKRDRRRQFDDLRLAVMPLALLEQSVIDLLAGDRHALGIVERDALSLAEERAVAPTRYRRQPLVAAIAFPHTEGIDVDSERAAVDRGDTQRDERHEPLRQLPGFCDRGAERFGGAQDRRAMRHDFCRVQDLAEHPALLGELHLQDRIAAVILDFPHPRHSYHLCRLAD